MNGKKGQQQYSKDSSKNKRNRKDIEFLNEK